MVWKLGRRADNPLKKFNRTLIDDVFIPIQEQVENLGMTLLIKSGQIISNIEHNSFNDLKRELKKQAIINLTNYSATGARERHATIEEAFQILEDLTGFEWNEKGSFTPDGAEQRYNEDVTISTGKRSLRVMLKGRLEDMEDGKINWGSLRSFFYNSGIKQTIQYLYPNAWRDLYKRLDSLFHMTSDPTMPRGRKYISSATQHSSKWFHERIMDDINKIFNSQGQWVKGDPQGRMR